MARSLTTKILSVKMAKTVKGLPLKMLDYTVDSPWPMLAQALPPTVIKAP